MFHRKKNWLSNNKKEFRKRSISFLDIEEKRRPKTTLDEIEAISHLDLIASSWDQSTRWVFFLMEVRNIKSWKTRMIFIFQFFNFLFALLSNPMENGWENCDRETNESVFSRNLLTFEWKKHKRKISKKKKLLPLPFWWWWFAVFCSSFTARWCYNT